jgi:hypothetical protein
LKERIMKTEIRTAWWLALAVVLALWSTAWMALDASLLESGFGVVQWKTA